MLPKALAYLPLSLALPLGLAVPLPAMAQADCPYAVLRIESSQYVDTDAVCEAARPWSEAGYEVLVFLTDVRPASEDAWFTLLDGVEAEAGLRDLTQADSFERAAIALEVTTATDLSYGVSLTYGETLYGSPLDTNEAALEGIKRRVRDRVASQDATWALTTGLEESADLAAIGEAPAPTPPANNAPAAGNTGLSPQVNSGGGGFGRLLAGGGLVTVGGSTVLGLALARQRRKRLQAQLATLQSRIANLLMGCESLLTGGQPENTVSYQLFVAADGERYPALTQDVKTWLAEARVALDQAFQVHRDLQENSEQLERPLKKRVAAWELLYLSFVGKRDRIRKMSDEELQTLLNPVLILGTAGFSQGLTTQLESIQKQIQGAPLKVKLMAVETEKEVDEEGILGRVEQVDAAIGRLRDAVTAAPKTLQTLSDRRQALSVPICLELGFSAPTLTQGIDDALAAAETTLTHDRLYLTVLDHCAIAETGLDTVTQLEETLQQVKATRADIQALKDQGYQPPQLPANEVQGHRLLDTLKQNLQRANYSQVSEQADNLARTAKAGLKLSQDWQALHQANQEKLEALRQATDRLLTLADNSTTQAWTTLQQYPPSNWQDLDGVLAHAQTLLTRLRDQDGVTLQQQNALEVQALEAVQKGTEQYQEALTAAEAELERVEERHDLVLQARSQLSGKLTEVDTYIQKVIDLTRKKVLGLVAVGEIDPRLQQSQAAVQTARTLAQGEQYFPACGARDNALRLLLVVYGEKLRERAAEVRSVVDNPRAHGAGRSELNLAQKQMPTDNEIRAAQGEALFTLYADANQARQTLDAAVADAQRAIRRSNSSSSSSSRSSFSSSSSFSSRSSSSSRRSSSSSSSRRSSSSRGSSRRR